MTISESGCNINLSEELVDKLREALRAKKGCALTEAEVREVVGTFEYVEDVVTT